MIEDYVEKTTVQNQYPVLTSSQQQGIVLQEDYFADRQVTTNDNVGYYVLPRGFFTYRSRSDTDLFVFNRNNLIDKGIISYYYPVFRPKNTDSNFLLRRLNHGIRSQLSMAAEGTGQHVLAHSKFKNMEFLVPSVPEQELIGAYFEKLDTLITLHQREESCAASFSASCFGTLKAFFWEQRKLSDLAEIVGGGTPDTNNSAYWDGDIDWYAPAEMEGQRYAKGSVRKITELGLQKSSAKILPAHRTVLFTSRAGIGKMAILQRPAATNQGFQSLVLKDGTDPYFIYSMGERIKGMAEGVASGSTFLEISGKMLGNLEVMVPNLKEQESIATFFRGIDDLITLHQCKPKS